MKNKKWITLATAVVLAVTALPLGVFAAKKDEAKLAKVTLNEVAHSIFYAPQYVVQILLERYAYSEISGTSILI